MVLVNAVGISIIIVMVPLGAEVHQSMLLLLVVRYHHGNARMSQRLPAHAEHQDEVHEATAHGPQCSQGLN